MNPNHKNQQMQNSSLTDRYRLEVTRASTGKITKSYAVGETYKIRLTGPGFRGFMMQVRKVRDNGRVDDVHRLGRFIPNEVTWKEQGIKLLSCSPVEKADSVTHSRNHRRNSLEIEWRPQRNEGTVQIMFTVVEDLEIFWTNQAFPSGRLTAEESTEIQNEKDPAELLDSPEVENEVGVRRKPPKEPVIRKTDAPRTTEGPTTQAPTTTEAPEEESVEGSGEEPQEDPSTTEPNAPEAPSVPVISDNADPPTETPAVRNETSAEETSTESNGTALIDFAIDKAALADGDEDTLIERIFSEIKDIIVSEKKNETTDPGKYIINLAPYSDEIDEFARAFKLDEEVKTPKVLNVKSKTTKKPEASKESAKEVTETDATSTSEASTTVKPTEPTTEKSRKEAETTTTPNTPEPTKEPEPEITTRNTEVTTEQPTEAESSTPSTPRPKPKTSKKPTKPPTSTPPQPVDVDGEQAHSKCDRDYWLECKDWADSECELIWVRQNCRKKCCAYLLRNLSN